MKVSSLLFQAAALVAAAAAMPQQQPPPAAEYVPVALEEPLDWSAGSRLFPGNVIAGYNAELNKYTKETWAAYMLNQCKLYSACDSSLSYSAINSGTPKDRYWFGYIFRGGATTQEDYTRVEGVQDAVAYTRKQD